MATPDLYAVVGDPIAHSKSPQIHRLFAEQTQQNLTYEAIRIDTDQTEFSWAIQELKQQGYLGLNVTVPFKLEAFELADSLSERAQVAHAVNTLIFNSDGTLTGDNTDGIGLVNDIEINGGMAFENKSVLILGAGGAVQGILQPLIEKNPKQVHIANRTAKRAQVLGDRFKANTHITASGWQDLPNQTFDIIINGTSASLEGKLPPISAECLKPSSLVYDMMYGNEPTVFMDWAQKHEPACHVMDGLGMLVGQAAESFRIWRSASPETASVIKTLRQAMHP